MSLASLAVVPRMLVSMTLATANRPAAVFAARSRPLCASALPDHLVDMREELASGEAQLFDVREPNEAQCGMLRDAQLVPLSALQQGVKPDFSTTTLTYVHCAAGIRVHYAAPILEQMGFERVVPLAEGYASLVNLGFEPKE